MVSYPIEDEPDLAQHRREELWERAEWQRQANAFAWAARGEPVPEAQRPPWLPMAGVGLASIEPVRWTMTIEQWLFFVDTCRATDTWKMLAGQKEDEGAINMYDLKDYFVVPWTRGTGCSVALLMNPRPRPVELMLSHAWAGSVIETFKALKFVVYHENVPPTTSIFFCTLCMYQPEDGAGPRIQEQLDLDPFADIIRSRPALGMRVLHTSRYEVYTRLWTAHEVDEASSESIEIRGLCDFDVFQVGSLQEALQINTSQATCRDEDRPMLVEKITSRGGFPRLDEKIAQFRKDMLKDFERRYAFVADGLLDSTEALPQHQCIALEGSASGAEDMVGDSAGRFRWNMDKERVRIAWWQERMASVRRAMEEVGRRDHCHA